jgi:hypothetical protein
MDWVALRGARADHIVSPAALQITGTPTMTMRIRKLIGAFALLALVAVWSLAAMALAQSVLTDINGFVAAIYYAVAGLGWVLPAMVLVKWMARPDADKG